MIKHCPLPNCSAQSWSRARVWAYDSPDACIDKLKVHSMVSSLHSFSADDAEEMACTPEIIDKVEAVEETKEDRRKYREWADEEWRKGRPQPSQPKRSKKRKRRR